MNKMYYLLLCLFLISTVRVGAQVTIGSDKDPHSAAILDLQSTSKGLKLPSVALDEDKTIFKLNPETDKASARGMMVYNTSDNNVYVWNGSTWKMFSDSGNIGTGTGNISVVGMIPTIAAAGGNTGAIVLSSDCNASGIWTIELKAANGAVLKNVNASLGTFELEFGENTAASSRNAIVMVKDPCGYTKDISVTQKGAINPEDYTPTLPTGITVSLSGDVCHDVRDGRGFEATSLDYTLAVSGHKRINKVTWDVVDNQGILTGQSNLGLIQTLFYKTQPEILLLAKINYDIVSLTLTAYIDLTLTDNSTAQLKIEKELEFRNGTCYDIVGEFIVSPMQTVYVQDVLSGTITCPEGFFSPTTQAHAKIVAQYTGANSTWKGSATSSNNDYACASASGGTYIRGNYYLCTNQNGGTMIYRAWCSTIGESLFSQKVSCLKRLEDDK